MQRIETAAEAHHAYDQLFDIAELRQDPDNLFRQMRTLRSGDRGLASHVFARLLAAKRTGELLMLPDEFNMEVQQWLQQQVCSPQCWGVHVVSL